MCALHSARIGEHVQIKILREHPTSSTCLQVTPDDPRLWCALGDLTLSDAHYETAWERSRRRSTRAQRSLARSAQREKGFEKVCVFPAPHYIFGEDAML